MIGEGLPAGRNALLGEFGAFSVVGRQVAQVENSPREMPGRLRVLWLLLIFPFGLEKGLPGQGRRIK